MRIFIVVSLCISLFSSCQTRNSNQGSDVRDSQGTNDITEISPAHPLFLNLKKAVQTVSKHDATQDGDLQDWLESYGSEEFSKIKDSQNWIECTKNGCKLSIKNNPGTGGEWSVVGRLHNGINLSGVPQIQGLTYTPAGSYTASQINSVGQANGPKIICARVKPVTPTPISPPTEYQCKFDIEGTGNVVTSPANNCSTALTRAENAVAEGNYKLIKLTDSLSTSANAVGYMRAKNTNEKLIDLWLCQGPYDYFYVESQTSSRWLAAANGGPKVEIAGDESTMNSTVTLEGQTATLYKFKVVYTVSGSDANNQAGTFFVKLKKP